MFSLMRIRIRIQTKKRQKELSKKENILSSKTELPSEFVGPGKHLAKPEVV